MILIPSIDLRNGRCVRLLKGDFDRETRYDLEPHELLQRYRALGASWLHVVDLDGAKDGRLANRSVIIRLASQKALHVQVGGGVRSKAVVDDLLRNGIDRVIVGSAAVEKPAEVQAFSYTTPGIKAFTNIEETLSVNLKFKKGILAQVISSYGFNGHRVRVEGSPGTLVLDPLMGYSGNKIYRVRGNQQTEVPFVAQDHFATEMDHFADCILNNKEPKTPGEEGLQDMKIIMAAYESAATGKTIKLA